MVPQTTKEVKLGKLQTSKLRVSKRNCPPSDKSEREEELLLVSKKSTEFQDESFENVTGNFDEIQKFSKMCFFANYFLWTSKNIPHRSEIVSTSDFWNFQSGLSLCRALEHCFLLSGNQTIMFAAVWMELLAKLDDFQNNYYYKYIFPARRRRENFRVFQFCIGNFFNFYWV